MVDITSVFIVINTVYKEVCPSTFYKTLCCLLIEFTFSFFGFVDEQLDAETILFYMNDCSTN